MVRNRSQADVFQSVAIDPLRYEQNWAETGAQAPAPGVTQIQNKSTVLTIAASTTGEKAGLLSGPTEKSTDPTVTRTVKVIFGGRISEPGVAPKSAVMANDGDTISSAGLVPEPKFGFEKPANADVGDADTPSFGGEAKDPELAPAGRAPTQSLNEAANPMPRPILSRESISPAADARATPWRATVERVASEIAAHVQLNKREAILHLDPPELGKIKIDLHLNGEKLEAHIFAEAHEARALIESHMSELRQALQAKNFDLVDVRVQGGWQGGMGDGMHGFPQQRHQHAATQQETIWASGNALESEMVEPKTNRGSTSVQGRVSMWA
jgi:hypothetical protein